MDDLEYRITMVLWYLVVCGWIYVLYHVVKLVILLYQLS